MPLPGADANLEPRALAMNFISTNTKRARTLALLGAILCCTLPVPALAQTDVGREGREPALRLVEPLDALVADLDRYIPERMAEAGVPGLAVALIRDSEVVWIEGYGLANALTRRPVTPETVFEVASISKTVTTYTALRLVEQGELSLDEPVRSFLTRPWLPPSAWRDRITLRHLASHSSGLTDRILGPDKTIEFEPGSRYLYSGVGFQDMQEVIEQLTGRSLTGAARELTLAPLHMSLSNFVNDDHTLIYMANGHVDFSLPLLAFLVPCVVLFLAIAPLALMIQRAASGSWTPVRKPLWLSAAVAATLMLALNALFVGRKLPGLALLNVIGAAVFGCALALLLWIGFRALGRVRPVERRRLLRLGWTVGVVALLLWLSGRTIVQVPRSPSPPPSAVGSLRSSAGDLALFLIEVIRPQHISPRMARQIQTAQTPINDDFSWGLGFGIQHSAQGDALWQMGITFGFRSVVAIYPAHGWGVVVLTNSDDGLPVAYDVAARALGGKANWSEF